MISLRTAALAAVLALPAGAVLAQTCVPVPAQQCNLRLPAGQYISYVGSSGGNIYCAATTPNNVQVDVYTVGGGAGYSCTYELPCQVFPPNTPISNAFCS